VSVAARRFWTFEGTFVREVYDRVHAEDVAYFAERPGSRARLRTFQPGEVEIDPPPDGERWTLTLVTQLGPGVYLRRFASEPSR
jgi:hypothetical protein